MGAGPVGLGGKAVLLSPSLRRLQQLGRLPALGGRCRLCAVGIWLPATGPYVGLPWFWGAPAVRGALRTGQALGWAGLLAHCCRGQKDIGVHKGKRGWVPLRERVKGV